MIQASRWHRVLLGAEAWLNGAARAPVALVDTGDQRMHVDPRMSLAIRQHAGSCGAPSLRLGGLSTTDRSAIIRTNANLTG